MTDLRSAVVRLLNEVHDLRLKGNNPSLRAALADVRDALAQPAPPAPIDLDELLSPKGAYEPGTGHEDGAQLVDQLEWWAPVYGCYTLDNLLDQIRARILPHLRPPIAGIDVPGGDGDYGDVLDLCAAEGVDPRVGVQLLKRAREAWGNTAQPAPPAEGEVSDEELDDITDETPWRGSPRHFGREVARAAIALDRSRRAPVQAAEGEVATIAARLKELSRAVTEQRWQEFSMRVPAEPLRDADLVMDRAAALLEHHQPPQPAEGEVQP